MTDDVIIPTREPKTPLSPLHEMLGKVRREKHAANFNRLLNHPKVYPWVHGATVGALDFTGVLSNPNVILLMGQHGGIMYERHQPGLFEIHCQCYPEGRGKWMLAFAQACQHWIFTKTECVEVMTRIPQGNEPARALATRAGLEFQFRNPTGWVMRNAVVPADIYSIHVNNWMRDAPGLVERGRWFNSSLVEQAMTIGVKAKAIDEEPYQRYLGAAVEMILAGQVQKAVVFFNRFAALSSYTPLVVTSAQPLAIVFGESVVVFREGGGFYIASHFNQSQPATAN